MIQRVQSLYLLGAFLVSIVLYYFPVLYFQSGDAELIFYVDKIVDSNNLVVLNSYPLLVVVSLSQFLIVFQIFNYKKRIRQMQTGKAVIILNIVFYAIIVAYLVNFVGFSADFSSFSLRIGLFVPIFLIILVLLANKQIKKDENLVRSIDRIR